ncbi:hypothetical protein [Streptomyces arboris]|uniref:hypothetical protein n=1 Tax=Streptomyces arboris TaxID=2600619 RepID=UPI003BF52A8B
MNVIRVPGTAYSTRPSRPLPIGTRNSHPAADSRFSAFRTTLASFAAVHRASASRVAQLSRVVSFASSAISRATAR